MKKILSFLLALALCAGLGVPALAAGFTDVPESHSFHDAVADCAAKGITSGYDDGTFRPTNSVTRAQFCVMLSRAFYPNEVKAHADAKTNWFSPNIQALSRAGILTGTSFVHAIESPSVMNQAISRYDMAVLMTRIMSDKGFSATEAQKSETQGKISDYKSIPTTYQDAVKNVFALGLITGYPNGGFGGENSMNRGQGCVVIYRMSQYVPVGGGSPAAQAPAAQPETPKQPETPAQSGSGTLANGKPITEENVLAVIQELLKEYPSGMKWDGKSYRTGTVSETMNMIVCQYTRAGTGGTITSTLFGCGGFASLVSDTIFGSGDANPARKVPLEQVRPGDVIIYLNADGKLLHVATAASRIYDTYEVGYEDRDYIYPVLSIYDGNHGDKVVYTEYEIAYSKSNPEYFTGEYYEVWTRYPE